MALLAAASTALASCAHAPRADPSAPRKRILFLPAENLSGSAFASAELVGRLAAELANAGIEPLQGPVVEDFLRTHRFRYTGGVSTEMAGAAARELEADGILVASVAAYEDAAMPRIALTARLVSTDGEPIIQWIDGVSMTGEDDPGPLRLWVITKMATLEHRAFSRLRRSLAAFLDGAQRAPPCSPERRFAPRMSYRSRSYRPARERPRVAVVPFTNASGREGAGELVALEFTRQMVATGRFDVLEPGRVRQLRLQNRIVIEGGVSNATVQAFGSAGDVDLLLGGEVQDYADAEFGRAAMARFSAVLLDGRDGTLVWSATSYHEGSEGVFLLNIGRVDRVAPLACRMVSAAVERVTFATR